MTPISCTNKLLTSFIVNILLMQYNICATTQLNNDLNYPTYQYGIPQMEQQTLNYINKPICEPRQREFIMKYNEILTQANEKKRLNNVEQQLRAYGAYGAYGTSDYYQSKLYDAGVLHKHELNANVAPSSLHTLPPHLRAPPSATSEILYATNTPPSPYTKSNAINSPSREPPPVPSSSAQHTKSHSNQKVFAPARPIVDSDVRHNNVLPYPPSFISITSTTRATPQQHNQQITYTKHDEQQQQQQRGGGGGGVGAGMVRSISRLTDIFALRQHQSLLDSYIPSWVLLRMLQQEKLAHAQKLHRFVATHTLAYPIAGKAA